MQLREIQYMMKVAETKNFTRASEQLFVSQSALSQSISRLENELGLRLFNRGTSEITLTHAGKVFYASAVEIMKAYNKMTAQMSDISSLKTGELRISVPPNYARLYIAGVIPAFKKNYPGIQLHLNETISSRIEDDCRRGDADFGVVSLPLTSEHFKTIPLFTEYIYLCMPSDDLFAQEYLPEEKDPMLDLSLVRDKQFILLKGGQRLRDTAIMLCEEAGFQPEIIFETSSVFTTVEFSRNGLGVGFVSEAIRKHTDEKGLRYFRILHHGKPFTRVFAAVYLEDAYLSAAAREFIRLAKEIIPTI